MHRKLILLSMFFALVLCNESGAANFGESFDDLTTGDLNSQNGWTGSALADVQTSVTRFGAKGLSITSDPDTAGAAIVAHTIDSSTVTTVYMRESATPTSGQYFGTIYIMEGANIISALCIANISATMGIYHLKASAWERIQDASVDTWYKITIDFPSSSTHRIYINDTLISLTSNSNFTNISSGIDTLKFLRYTKAVAGTSYFDHVSNYTATTPLMSTFTNSFLKAELACPVAMTAIGSNLNYLVTESSAAPSSGDAGWAASYTSHTTTTYGTKTLYGWAKNTSTSEISTLPMLLNYTYWTGDGLYASIKDMMPGSRYSGNPIIEHETGTWKARQVHYPFVMINPWDSTEVLMYYGGGDYTANDYKVGLATAARTDVYAWAESGSNPILSPPTGYSWLLGPDFVFYNSSTDELWLYVTGRSTGGEDRVLLFKGSDKDTFVYYGVVLSPSGDETDVLNPGMIITGGNYYMYYIYDTATLKHAGIKLATSTDGLTFSKVAGGLVSIGQTYDSKYIEGCQAFLSGTTYTIMYSGYNGTDNCNGTWSASMVGSPNYNGPFYKCSENPIFEKGASGQWDDTHIATNFVTQIDQKVLFFYQGTGANGAPSDCFSASLWDMGLTEWVRSKPQVIVY